MKRQRPALPDPAFSRELDRVAYKTRRTGIVLALVGAGFAFWSKQVEEPAMWRLAAILTITAGAGLLIFGMMQRSLHYRLMTGREDSSAPPPREIGPSDR